MAELTLRGLLPWLRGAEGYARLRRGWEAGEGLEGAMAEALLPPLLAALMEDHAAPTLLVVPTVKEARRMLQALRIWMPPQVPLLDFPEPPLLPYEHAPWPPESREGRMAVLAALFLHRVGARPAPLIIASAAALVRRVLPYRQLRKAALKIRRGGRHPLRALARTARGLGYETVSVVTAPGQMAVRGGLLDLFPPHADHPLRLDYFGEEVESIRTFDPQSQRSLGEVDSFWLLPVRSPLPRDGARALPAVQALMERPLPPDLTAPLEAVALALEAGHPFPELEFYLPRFYAEVHTLLHHFPPTARLVVWKEEAVRSQWAALLAREADLREEALAEGRILPDHPSPYLDRERWEQAASRLPRLRIVPPEEGAQSPPPLLPDVEPQPTWGGRLDEALGKVRQWVGLGDTVVLVSRQAARLAELWERFNPPPVVEGLPSPPSTQITFVRGAAFGGFEVVEGRRSRHLLTDEELFGWRPPLPRRRRRRRVESPERPFGDLRVGEPVVHEDYGVGLFRGLVWRTVDEVEREYLLVEYAGGDRLYVPIHQADRLSRYVGAGDAPPLLHRLGGGRWAEAKRRVRRATDALARELLDLYARRRLVRGHAFAPDTPWQAELEASFPYVETEDQAAAIEAVKRDMERPYPMDRLICGDAGYGKTEVALRAAFKAVMDGKQVALLVPTTILAQQHFERFRRRLAPYPVVVELLSRFRTPAEQREVLRRLAGGQVDIVVGTHRLLQEDVRFRDLGLVIIDEEQRFGVAHKERLKRMRTEVDVLTMTATPIPRTLYLALSGAMEISLIETPPQERLPIATYVGPYDAEIVRRAVLRELKRGGQGFYLHNRVETLPSVVERLRKLVPEARVGMAHGQMAERELARVMTAFAEGEIDLLAATTIIESGLDFPNANTIFIEQAEHFGLAQLYQLRGRVGRGSRRGYAYLFHSRHLPAEGRARLRALVESDSQGGGFALALRDLELRGGGELLGARQHGHIAAVGFTLYTRMLNRAIARLKAAMEGAPPPPEPLGAITIELPLPIGFPARYIPDAALRLRLYRRMAELTSAEEVSALEAELRDRFGPLPEETANLLYQLRLKVLARQARVEAITVQSGQVVLRMPWLSAWPAEQRARLVAALRGTGGRVGRDAVWLPLAAEETVWREALERLLVRLSDRVPAAGRP